jgi:lipoate---protein ligase
MSVPGPTLRLYTYSSYCALVGKFQNIDAEVDIPFCRQQGIAINRRPTGGGAILMGDSQLGIAVINSSLVPQVPQHPKEIFALYSRSLIAGLEHLGIHGRLEAKNDIRVNGRKIAGLGVCRNEQGAFLFHTSLLVDLDIDLMLQVLKIPAAKLSDKLRTRVQENLTTVRREIGVPIAVEEVRRAIRTGFAATEGMSFQPMPLTPEETSRIRELETKKYSQDAWVFQRVPTPDMNGTSLRKTAGGLLRLYLSLAGERIKDITITGDFVSDGAEVLALERALSSLPAEEEAVRRIVTTQRTAASLGDVSREDLVGAVMEAVTEARKMSSQGGPYGCFVDTRG